MIGHHESAVAVEGLPLTEGMVLDQLQLYGFLRLKHLGRVSLVFENGVVNRVQLNSEIDEGPHMEKHRFHEGVVLIIDFFVNAFKDLTLFDLVTGQELVKFFPERVEKVGVTVLKVFLGFAAIFDNQVVVA